MAEQLKRKIKKIYILGQSSVTRLQPSFVQASVARLLPARLPFFSFSFAFSASVSCCLCASQSCCPAPHEAAAAALLLSPHKAAAVAALLLMKLVCL